MRILVAQPGPAFSVHDVYVGWVEALRSLGHQVATYDLSNRLAFYELALIRTKDGEIREALNKQQAIQLAVNGLFSAMYRLRPDMLIVISAYFYGPLVLDLIRSQGTQVVAIHTESPYEDARQLIIAEHADINLINDPTNLEEFRKVNPRSYYSSHSYRPGFHRPGPAKPDIAADLAFVGTAFPSRTQFFEAMDLSELDVLLAGNWVNLPVDSPLMPYVATDPGDCIDNDQAVEIYQSARCGINLYRREADPDDDATGWSCGPREVEMAACGLFFLRDPRGESDELFPMLPTFHGPDEASDMLRWYLARDELRAELADKARAAIMDRTFVARACDLMSVVDRP